MDKQLSGINRVVVSRRARNGAPLNLRELAVFCECSYSVVRGWVADGLPVLSGKVFLSDFEIWRRRLTGLEADPRIASRRPKSIAGKSC